MLIPVIIVRDKMTGTTRIVGANTHDQLTVYPDHLEYYNLQNGCGSREAYEFIDEDHDPSEWWSDPHVKMVTLEEWIELSKAQITEDQKNTIELYRAFVKMMQARMMTAPSMQTAA